MNLIQEITKSVLEKQVNTVDEWLFANWVTIWNFKKFKVKTTSWIPEYNREETKEWMIIKWKSNIRYNLYPARWRNAKKIISSLFI